MKRYPVTINTPVSEKMKAKLIKEAKRKKLNLSELVREKLSK